MSLFEGEHIAALQTDDDNDARNRISEKQQQPEHGVSFSH